MIYPIIISLAGMFTSPSNDLPVSAAPKTEKLVNFQEYKGSMTVVEFKAQDYCRAELKDFDFDAHFSIVSADVYFSGANFPEFKKGSISNSSLKPIRQLMDHCTAGTVVTFDNIKVKGPDNEVRTIDGVSYKLY